MNERSGGRLGTSILLLVALVPAFSPAKAAASADDKTGKSFKELGKEMIQGADDEEERQGLTRARDDIDTEMKQVAAQKDAEIEKLRKENEALRARLAK